MLVRCRHLECEVPGGKSIMFSTPHGPPWGLVPKRPSAGNHMQPSNSDTGVGGGVIIPILQMRKLTP